MVTCVVVTRATATLLLSLGGFDLRSAERSKVVACWASWADPMIQAGHPTVATLNGVTFGRGIMVTKHGSRQSGSDTVGG